MKTPGIPVLALGLGLLIAPVPLARAAAYFVSPQGSDRGPGTRDAPFGTIQHAVTRAQAGDTVCVRGGVYREVVRVTRSGAEGAPLVISGAPGETAIIDGEGRLPGVDKPMDIYRSLVHIGGSFVVFQDFEVRNSTGRGVDVSNRTPPCHHTSIRQVSSHHNAMSGIICARGHHNLIEGCRVWQNTQLHHKTGYRPWPGNCFLADEAHSVIRRSHVYNNYGEGVIVLRSEHCTVEDSIVYDNKKVQIYLDNAPHAIVRRNLVYLTDDREFWRGKKGTPGLILGDEPYGRGEGRKAPLPGHDRVIVNNIIVGTGFAWWPYDNNNPESRMKNDLVAHNTIINPRGACISIAPRNHLNVRIENNVSAGGNGDLVRVPDSQEIRFSNNLWSRAVGGAASSPYDVTGDPMLGRAPASKELVAGKVEAAWFSLQASSPARDRGKVLPEVTDDLLGRRRDTRPDIGALEYAR